ncbi:hypothetical protein Lwal_1381 [Legionella waltersii]|uniref:Uncharacterized protein n=1 Tax=Legionella waltersii TaxID=66969 RepID=A0A0W1AD94_9GAMM|nr:hypothetical protein Lwal_1381 [Legionella waltersii]SNV13003.1 Uncharacterised protein [Legionella waltersii]
MCQSFNMDDANLLRALRLEASVIRVTTLDVNWGKTALGFIPTPSFDSIMLFALIYSDPTGPRA